jgi:hypothetical protein
MKDFISEVDKCIQEQKEDQHEESQGKFKYKDPKTNEVYEYERKGIYRKDGRVLVPVKD